MWNSTLKTKYPLKWDHTFCIFIFPVFYFLISLFWKMFCIYSDWMKHKSSHFTYISVLFHPKVAPNEKYCIHEGQPIICICCLVCSYFAIHKGFFVFKQQHSSTSNTKSQILGIQPRKKCFMKNFFLIKCISMGKWVKHETGNMKMCKVWFYLSCLWKVFGEKLGQFNFWNWKTSFCIILVGLKPSFKAKD